MSKTTTMILLCVCTLFGALTVTAGTVPGNDAPALSTNPVFGYFVYDSGASLGLGMNFNGCAFACNTHEDCGGAACGYRYCVDYTCVEC